jgi:hypothetical protein
VTVEAEGSPPRRRWSFYVAPVDHPNSSGEFYYAGVREVELGLVQLEALLNSLPQEFHHCCITCGLVPVISEHLDASVRSSRTVASQRAVERAEFEEMRSEAANKVWKRMERELVARYVVEEDRYYFDRRSRGSSGLAKARPSDQSS